MEDFIVDITRERALDFMDNPQLVSITNTNNTGWITDEKIDKSIKNKQYDDISIVQVRHDDMDWCMPITIENRVVVNRYGDMVIGKETYDILNTSSELYYYVDNEPVISNVLINPIRIEDDIL